MHFNVPTYLQVRYEELSPPPRRPENGFLMKTTPGKGSRIVICHLNVSFMPLWSRFDALCSVQTLGQKTWRHLAVISQMWLLVCWDRTDAVWLKPGRFWCRRSRHAPWDEAVQTGRTHQRGNASSVFVSLRRLAETTSVRSVHTSTASS